MGKCKVKSKVAFSVVKEQTAAAVEQTVRCAMNLVEWDQGLGPASIFLKVNLLCREVMPGQGTSPWVFTAVLQEVKERFPDAVVYFGDWNSKL